MTQYEWIWSFVYVADVARAVCEKLIEQFALAQLCMSLSDTHTEPPDENSDTPVADVFDDLDTLDQQLGKFANLEESCSACFHFLF